MSVVRRTLPHPPLVVFDALVSPETYPEWLVGCREIRAVDTDWPAVQSRFHHRVGLVGPLTVEDSTKVLAIETAKFGIRVNMVNPGYTVTEMLSASLDDPEAQIAAMGATMPAGRLGGPSPYRLRRRASSPPTAKPTTAAPMISSRRCSRTWRRQSVSSLTRPRKRSTECESSSRWRSMSARIWSEVRPGAPAVRRATGSPAPL